jgi:hypothetical protein
MNDNDLIETRQTYTTLIKGNPVIVQDVPMLKDLESGETYFAPEVAEQLFELLSHPENKTGVMTVDVYKWQGGARVNA